MAYGDKNYGSLVKALGAGGDVEIVMAVFTTAGGSEVTVDATKTRGVNLVTRTGTGVVEITLPWKAKRIVPICTQSGTTAQIAGAAAVDGTNKITVTTVTAGGNTPADSTGIVITVWALCQIGG